MSHECCVRIGQHSNGNRRVPWEPAITFRLIRQVVLMLVFHVHLVVIRDTSILSLADDVSEAPLRPDTSPTAIPMSADVPLEESRHVIEDHFGVQETILSRRSQTRNEVREKSPRSRTPGATWASWVKRKWKHALVVLAVCVGLYAVKRLLTAPEEPPVPKVSAYWYLQGQRVEAGKIAQTLPEDEEIDIIVNAAEELERRAIGEEGKTSAAQVTAAVRQIAGFLRETRKHMEGRHASLISAEQILKDVIAATKHEPLPKEEEDVLREQGRDDEDNTCWSELKLRIEALREQLTPEVVHLQKALAEAREKGKENVTHLERQLLLEMSRPVTREVGARIDKLEKRLKTVLHISERESSDLASRDK
ncbi:hypothetical protein TGME49_257970 [Toxoplasma gondii ME49]|uniref:Uncharacterized protein n=4 Tax=Toxoplasma gondii TaxID=5811 RepID=B6KB37_TOXGV|nr:hypothetical protein TGME49_257970 [Toxoplasma gondii ME49]ESS32280.1 hypothetical protein TGVEG_257970 [Toxoplasma gondii VEG]KYF41782.1 hypothetical protein TGARI_257970 [Toxoplasma gondii ARI]PIL96558.1 hypothetical protein TGCOUG_257970 [Toxoplasma gondii COUG]EPT29302.1 hypothetical protein TGME49_257970 [Toxoplasma gondii ME49]CEL74515.1 TPA: hypothetical protein BN1205_076570 [Toxoplasma gondii VEG]|eukprot:XP_002365021.1 hypothetical protein TGME49_257970 [Toxoplasma gondii ME49]